MELLSHCFQIKNKSVMRENNEDVQNLNVQKLEHLAAPSAYIKQLLCIIAPFVLLQSHYCCINTFMSYFVSVNANKPRLA